MLKDGFVLTVICLIVVGGIFAWWTQTTAHSVSATVQPQVEQPAPPPVKAPAKKKTAGIPKPTPPLDAELPLSAEIAALTLTPAPATPSAAVVQPDSLPFPAVGQVETGSHEDSVTDKFGTPALSAVTSSNGHKVETLVYARDRGRRSTLIRLEDGKVATVYTRLDPTLPPGLSAPRRFPNQ